MDIKDIVYGLDLFLHNLFTVVWMGGVIVAAISVLPAAKDAFGPGPQVKKFMTAFLSARVDGCISAWLV